MSKYFAPHPETRDYKDIIWRRHPALKDHPSMDNIWLVYLEDYLLGEIHYLKGSGYSAISHRGEIELNYLGEGFGTRWAATEFILRVSGSHPKR